MDKQTALMRLVIRHGHKAMPWGADHLCVASLAYGRHQRYWLTEYIPATRRAVMAWLGY